MGAAARKAAHRNMERRAPGGDSVVHDARLDGVRRRRPHGVRDPRVLRAVRVRGDRRTRVADSGRSVWRVRGGNEALGARRGRPLRGVGVRRGDVGMGCARENLWPFAAATVVFGAPWYLWIAYCTANPIWPFLGRRVGHGFWNDADYAWLDWFLRSYGWGRTLRSLLLLPWNLAFGQPIGEIRLQPAPFLLIPVTVWWAFRRKTGRLLLAAIAAYVLFWFSTSQQLRFLVPVLPVLVFLDARALDELTAAARRRLPSWAQGAIAALVFIAFSFPLLGTYRAVLQNGPLPTTRAAREAFLRGRLPSYSIYSDLNRRYGRGYTIYALHDEGMKYYCDGIAVGDWFGDGRYGDIPMDDAPRLLSGPPQTERGLSARQIGAAGRGARCGVRPLVRERLQGWRHRGLPTAPGPRLTGPGGAG